MNGGDDQNDAHQQLNEMSQNNPQTQLFGNTVINVDRPSDCGVNKRAVICFF